MVLLDLIATENIWNAQNVRRISIYQVLVSLVVFRNAERL